MVWNHVVNFLSFFLFQFAYIAFCIRKREGEIKIEILQPLCFIAKEPKSTLFFITIGRAFHWHFFFYYFLSLFRSLFCFVFLSYLKYMYITLLYFQSGMHGILLYREYEQEWQRKWTNRHLKFKHQRFFRFSLPNHWILFAVLIASSGKSIFLILFPPLPPHIPHPPPFLKKRRSI